MKSIKLQILLCYDAKSWIFIIHMIKSLDSRNKEAQKIELLDKIQTNLCNSVDVEEN